MKYLIVGNKGQLGKEFEKILTKENAEFKGYDIDTLDIVSIEQVLAVFDSYNPDMVINCAAYNQVDLAEKNEYDAYSVNVLGVRNIAIASKKFNAFLVHFGTDYVFDGKNSVPYTEKDKTNPIGSYGKSKMLGELAVQEETENFLIFRVSWLYGEGQQNFIYKLMQWSSSGNELKIAVDEISIPTHTKIVAQNTIKALSKGIAGIYHLTNTDYCSRFEWAKEILELTGRNNVLLPVSKDIFNLPAKRPDFSAMSNQLISNELNITIPHWKESLKEYVCSFIQKLQ